MICIWKMKFPLLGMFILVNIAFLSAQNMDHGGEIEEIIGQIEREQNVGSLKEIELEEVDPTLFEELGDSVMGELIGDEKRHEWMDEMMGPGMIGGQTESIQPRLKRWSGSVSFVDSRVFRDKFSKRMHCP